MPACRQIPGHTLHPQFKEQLGPVSNTKPLPSSIHPNPYQQGSYPPSSIPFIHSPFPSSIHRGTSLISSQRRMQASVTAPIAGRVVTPQAVTRFRPCIDIHKGKVKQIVGSTLKDLPALSSGSQAGGQSASMAEPVVNFESEKSSGEFALLYASDGLPGGHVIMLGADDASKQAALEALAAYPGGLQLGGGVNPDNALQYLEAGASHVIVTSYVFREGTVDMERLKALVGVVGKERLVLDLSCRKKDGQYMVVTDRWQRFSDLAVNEETLGQLAGFADEFLVHGVDVEGMKLGIDAELVELLGKHSPLPVTYAGGARTLEDLETVREAGQGRVDITVGSALDIFGGQLKYEDVVAWHKKQHVLA